MFRPFFGGIAVLLTTFWGDQPAGNVPINCLDIIDNWKSITLTIQFDGKRLIQGNLLVPSTNGRPYVRGVVILCGNISWLYTLDYPRLMKKTYYLSH